MKVKINHQCNMATHFLENRGAGGKRISSLYKAWRTQKCEHEQLSLTLVSPHFITFNLKKLEVKGQVSLLTQSNRMFLQIQIFLFCKISLLTQATITVDI